MLEKTREKISKNNWKNIDLIHGDITKFKNPTGTSFDAAVCTLGLSIIPEYKSAYSNLISHVKKHGEIIIGDMQLASGWRAKLNPITVLLAKKFGGSHEGHQNSLEIQSMMQTELSDVKKRDFFFRSYYYCIGKKK